jgi:aminoglycoside phosphotransferase (APT) family kinase protein
MYARLQVDCIAHADRLHALGCPRRGLAALERGLAPLAADDRALRNGDSDGLSDAEVERLRAALPSLLERCATLRVAAVPLTLEHGDLWPGNFLVDGTRCVLIDWEDAAVGHPFFSLAPLLVGLATYQPALNRAAVRRRIEDAYLAPFAAVAAPDRLRDALRVAMPLGFVDMAIRYRLQPQSAAALHPWMRDLVPQTLRLALAAM